MENIEAMLCAYIEGDLDPAGRAEIEKHLQTNPQHRKLIAELVATRDLVRNLPRVNAPIDVGDSLRGQVERSILLDDSMPAAAKSSLRLNRWPQFVAVAAVFVLTAGLGIIIFKMVMPTFRPPPFAEMTTQQAEPGASADTTATRDEAAASLALSSSKPTLQRAAITAAPVAINNTTTIQTNSQIDLNAIGRRLEKSGFANTNRDAEQPSAVYLVVDSPDPSTTNDKLARFLNSNGITWTPIPDAGPTTSPSTMPAAGDNLDVTQGAIAEKVVPMIPDEQADGMAAKSIAGTEKDRAKYQIVAAAPANVNPASTMPAELDLRNAQAQQSNNAATQDLYVARGMTRRQADQLRQALATQVGQVTVYDNADKSAAATTQPSNLFDAMAAQADDSADKKQIMAARGAGSLGGGAGAGGGIGGGGGARGGMSLAPAATRPDAAPAGAAPAAALPITHAASAPEQPMDVVIVIQNAPQAPANSTPPMIDPSVPATQP